MYHVTKSEFLRVIPSMEFQKPKSQCTSGSKIGSSYGPKNLKKGYGHNENYSFPFRDRSTRKGRKMRKKVCWHKKATCRPPLKKLSHGGRKLKQQKEKTRKNSKIHKNFTTQSHKGSLKSFYRLAATVIVVVVKNSQ